MVQTASSTTVRKYNIITYYTRTQSASESNAIEHFILILGTLLGVALFISVYRPLVNPTMVLYKRCVTLLS